MPDTPQNVYWNGKTLHWDRVAGATRDHPIGYRVERANPWVTITDSTSANSVTYPNVQHGHRYSVSSVQDGVQSARSTPLVYWQINRDWAILLDYYQHGWYENRWDFGDNIINFSYQLGMRGNYDDIATATQLQFTVWDPNRQYSGNAISTIGDMARLYYKGEIVCTTWVRTINSHHHANGYATTFHCTGRLDQLEGKFYESSYAKDVLVTDELKNILFQDPIPYPYAHSFFLLGHSTLGNTKLIDPEVNTFSAIINLTTKLPYTLDIPNISTSHILGDVIGASLGGILYENRIGRLMFHGAPSLPATDIVDAGLATDIQSSEGDIINSIAVQYSPKEEKTDYVIFRSIENVYIGPGDWKQFHCVYRPESGSDFGSIAFEERREVVDLFRLGASTAKVEGYTNNETDIVKLHVWVVDGENGKQSDVFVLNASYKSTSPWDHVGINVSLIELTSKVLLTYRSKIDKRAKSLSVSRYGVRPRTLIPLRFAIDNDDVDARANKIFDYYSEPKVLYKNITFTGDGGIGEMIVDRDIGNLIRVQNSVDNHDHNYYIIGETVQAGQNGLYSLSWLLLDAER